MRDAIALTTEQLIEIREKAKVISNPAKPIIALPDFDLLYGETRKNGANYILQYSWRPDDLVNEGSCVEIKFRFSYDGKEQFKIYVGIEENTNGDSPYRMFCGIEEGYVIDKYWQEQLEKVPEDSDFANWQALAYDYLLINSYIAYHDQNEVFDVEERVAKMPSKKSNKKKSGNNNKVRLYKVYKLKKSWKTAKKLKTPHKIECGAWGVRGHFRHYKSGQTIFIRAYVKGKDKANYKGKEYKLLGAIS